VIYEEASKSGNKLARKNLDEMEVKQRLRSAKDLWERGRDLASKEPVKAEELLLKALSIVENELEAGYANVSISISESGFMSATGLGVNVADALGEFYCHNGPDYKKAVEYYKKAVYKFGDTSFSFWALERLFERIGDTKSLTSLYISKLEYALNPRPGHFLPDFVEGQHETMLSIMQNLFAEGAYGQAVAEYKKYSDLEDECDHYAFSDYDPIRIQEAENNLRVYLKRLAKEVLR
jgi:tetratricopeptide (TPR) repeat protein